MVTGGAGFIGSNLVDRLLTLGNWVSVIDDLSSGREENLINASQHEKFNLVRGSVCDLTLLKQSCVGVDYVFHLAAIASVSKSLEEPIKSHEVNLTGALNVLVAARENRVKKVIFASSSAVYGDTPSLFKLESHPPHPQSPYALSKLAAEQYCNIFTQEYGLSTICLRYFNVYGPRQDQRSEYAAVIPRFIHLIMQNQSPIIYGDGTQIRDFIFVQDVVRANILAAISSANGIYNIGSGQRVTVNELTQLLVQLLEKPSLKPHHTRERPGDVKRSVSGGNKALEIGFKTRLSLERGLIKTIQSANSKIKK